MHPKIAEVEYRARRRYPDKNVSVSGLQDCDPLLATYLHTSTRVRVTNLDHPEDTRTGRVGVSGGWQPVYLLLHRRTSNASSDTLGPRDKVVAVQNPRTRKYQEVTP